MASAANLKQTQHQVLKHILKENLLCEYGQRYEFEHISTVAEFQRTLPIVRYENIQDHVESQSQGQLTLCGEPVLFYEETSGSSSGRKRLPYTQASLCAVQNAINPWLFDLIKQRPGVALGHSYFSISPAGRDATSTSDGTPIGAPSDLAFLTPAMQAAFVELLAVPPAIARITDIDEWRYHTLFALLSDAMLSLISIWNPSFITLIVDSIPASRDRLIRDLTLSEDRCSLDNAFWQAIKPRCNRAEILNRVAAATSDIGVNTRCLWPALDTISCWTDGSAKHALPALQRYFPHVHIQPKGLLATEAVVTLPFTNCDYPVLAAKSGFFEFLDLNGEARLAHELKQGHTYEVVVTTFGGLYRYALGDTVCVRGHYQQLPLLEFIGRSGLSSDLRGEKFNDAFAARCLNDIRGFSLLATVANPSTDAPTGYQLLVDAEEVDEIETDAVCTQVEQRLHSNPQYEYARRLGQLQPLKLLRIQSPENHYVDYRLSQGQQLGDIKPISLCIDAGLADHLRLATVDPAPVPA